MGRMACWCSPSASKKQPACMHPDTHPSAIGNSPVNERAAMSRVHQVVLIGSTILGSWLGMQAVHESGHFIGAWLSGGRVARVVLNPLTISRTDLASNPRPLFVVWAGPVGGIAIPLVLWGIAAASRLPGAFVLRFFA